MTSWKIALIVVAYCVVLWYYNNKTKIIYVGGCFASSVLWLLLRLLRLLWKGCCFSVPLRFVFVVVVVHAISCCIDRELAAGCLLLYMP